MDESIKTIKLQTMGAAIDRQFRLAEGRDVMVMLSAGDMYYDSNDPTNIHEITNDGYIAHDIQDGETFFNQANGLIYKFTLSVGMIFDGFGEANRTYVIRDEIIGDFTIPDGCTLVFQGGKITGKLEGNLTRIVAPPVQIFDLNLELSGTFSNECAYPEWWGAQPDLFFSESGKTFPYDCSYGIQAAFDSPFGVIRFCPRSYYIDQSVILKKVKTVEMAGEGLTYHRGNIVSDTPSTVIWTGKNIDAFVINMANEGNNWHQRLSITGGCIDVSKTTDYTCSAMVFYLTMKSYRNAVISTSLTGPRNEENEFAIKPNLIFSKGFEIRKPLQPDQMTGSLFTAELTLHISDFGTGFSTETVDDKMRIDDHGVLKEITGIAVTSLMLHGVIDGCACFINSPYRCFEGGKIDATLQVRKERLTGTETALVIGDFKDCHIDCKVWDAAGINIFELVRNDDRSNRNISLGPHTMQYLSSVYDIIRPEVLAMTASLGNGTTASELGHHDLNALGTATSYLGYKDYIHTIDNDLMSIDRAVDGVEISVAYQDPPVLEGQAVACASTKSPEPYYIGSPFDTGGMKFFNLSPGMGLEVAVTFPMDGAFRYRNFNCVILHLRNAVYNHFNKLRITAHVPSGEETAQAVLYDGSYHQYPTADGQSEVIIPLRQRKSMGNDDPVIPFQFASLSFLFTDFVAGSNIWGDEQFGLFLEGRLNRPVSQPVFTSSGGSLGGNLTKKGLPYIFGTRVYGSIAALPEAADGAMAVVGRRPVVKTPAGWMYVQLCASTVELRSLNGLNEGQSAFDTTMGKPLWFHDNSWRDALGNVVYPRQPDD